MNKPGIAIVTVLASFAAAQTNPGPKSDKERLIGAWRLVNITGPDGKPVSALPRGMLIYTRDGHMSVQLMYPKAESALSNQYVQAGYEASFGSYDVDAAKHMVTHRVQGSVTRGLLVGKDLTRIFQFTNDGHLLIKSARPDEHWAVTWEHY